MSYSGFVKTLAAAAIAGVLSTSAGAVTLTSSQAIGGTVGFSNSGSVSNTTQINANGTYNLNYNTSLLNGIFTPKLFEISLGSWSKNATFSLIDTNPESRTVEYWLFEDNNAANGQYSLTNPASYVYGKAKDVAGSVSIASLSNIVLGAGKDYILAVFSVFPLAANREVKTQISAVPVPAAIWLFGSALLGFMGFSSRRKR